MDGECSMCAKSKKYGVAGRNVLLENKIKMDCGRARYEGVEWSDHGQEVRPSASPWLITNAIINYPNFVFRFNSSNCEWENGGITFFPTRPDSERNSLWEVLPHRPFVLLVRETCRWKWVWSNGGTIVGGETKVLWESVPMPIFPQLEPRLVLNNLSHV
jgi:hypothetical protein